MAGTIFKTTFTNSDENFVGWNNRTIYLFSKVEGIIIEPTKNVFEVIENKYKKGNYYFPKSFFNRIDDGYTLKITMYFYSEVNGNYIKIGTGVEVGSSQSMVFTKNGSNHICDTTDDKKLFKYEAIITKYYDQDINETMLNVIGNVIYSAQEVASPNDDRVNFISINGALSINATSDYNLLIKNDSELLIKVIKVIIEEIN
jgi:hypothetical protein